MRFIDLFKNNKEPRLKVLMISDKPGWAVDSAVSNLIRVMPCDFTKIYFTTVESQQILDLAPNFDLIYYSNSELGRHLGILDKIKTPMLVGIRSHRYTSYVDKLPELLKKHKFYIQVINTELLKDFPGSRFIPNGIDYQFKPTHEFVVGFSGHVGDYKGYPLIQQACQELGVKLISATGDIKKKNMHKFYKQLDLLVSASVNEGFCNPLNEAMAMNIPVITTDTGAAKEYNIVKIERSVEGIKNGILKFYTHPQVKHLTWKNVGERFLDYFYDIVIKEVKKGKQSLHTNLSAEELENQRIVLKSKYF